MNDDLKRVNLRDIVDRISENTIDRTAGFPKRLYMEGKQSAESAVSICPD